MDFKYREAALLKKIYYLCFIGLGTNYFGTLEYNKKLHCLKI